MGVPAAPGSGTRGGARAEPSSAAAVRGDVASVRAAVPGGQPQLLRKTSSVGSSSTVVGRSGLAMRSSSREQARSPSSRIGWWIVVSEGSNRLPGKMSSNPVTESSSGTRTPPRASAWSTPMAIWSFAHTMASGSSLRSASSFSPASSPLCALNRPQCEPIRTVPGWDWTTSLSAILRSLASGALCGPSTWKRRLLPCSSIRCVTSAAEPDRLSAVTTSAACSSGSPATTTTGRRSARRASSAEGTIPSPMSRPSTLPDSVCSRARSTLFSSRR